MEEVSTKQTAKSGALGVELALIPIGVALNIALGSLVHALKIPIFVDAVGTIAVTLLVGLRAGIIVGVLSSVLPSAFGINATLWAFSGTQAVIALFAALAASRGVFRKLWTTIVAGVVLGIIAGLVSAPVVAYVFGGVTGSGSSFFVALMMKTGHNLWQSVVTTGMILDSADKVVQMILVWWLMKGMPKSLLRRFPGKSLKANGFLG